MASRVVLDSSAVLALLFNEPGAKTALTRGENGIMSAVSYSETLSKSLDKGVPIETIKLVLDGLKLDIRPFDTDHALAAATFRKSTRHLDVSFADRACLATATLAKLPVLTGDREWTKVELGIKVILIR